MSWLRGLLRWWRAWVDDGICRACADDGNDMPRDQCDLHSEGEKR